MKVARAGARSSIGWLFVLVLLVPGQQARAAGQTDKALMLIRAACSLPDTSLAIRPTPDGRLELQITLASGQHRSVNLVHSDFDEFTTTVTTRMAERPKDFDGCTNPYIDDVMAGLGQLPERPSAPAPAPAYEPPVLPTPALPATSLPSTSLPSPTLAPAYPPTGDLPVSVINNAATGAAANSAQPVPAGGLVMRVLACRAAGGDVVCDVKVSNDSGQDVQLLVQGAYSNLYGEDGSRLQVAWVTMGNQRMDVRWGSHQAQLKLIAGTAPIVNVHFAGVPSALTAIRRLELSMGAAGSGGAELQKITLADVPIQGR